MIKVLNLRILTSKYSKTKISSKADAISYQGDIISDQGNIIFSQFLSMEIKHCPTIVIG